MGRKHEFDRSGVYSDRNNRWRRYWTGLGAIVLAVAGTLITYADVVAVATINDPDGMTLMLPVFAGGHVPRWAGDYGVVPAAIAIYVFFVLGPGLLTTALLLARRTSGWVTHDH